MQKSIKLIIMCAALSFTERVWAQAYIARLINETNFEYQVVGHPVVDECNVLQKDPYIFSAQTTKAEDILLGAQQPSFVLQPIAYIDPQDKKRYSFLNTDLADDINVIEQAFTAWKKSSQQEKKYTTAQEWYADWVGGNVLLVLKQVEILGYIVNMSRAVLGNNVRSTHAWIEWAQGVFARLALEITIKEHPRKGVIFELKSQVSEGVYCSPKGTVERF